jgi:hypothetical protein
LLHTLRVDKFFLAKLENLTMIQTHRERADEQQRTEH